MIDGRTIAAGPPWLDFDAVAMRESFDRAPFGIRHRLTEHPLLQLPRIIELARVLPARAVEYNAGNLPLNQDPDLTPRNGLSIADTLARIETCGSWMVLKNVQQDPEYRRLLDECLDEVKPLIAHTAPGMRERKGFIFVSSPGAVTPYHVDFEYNFLLQVRGEKVITVFDPRDRSLFSELDRERFVNGSHRNLPWRDEFAARGTPFALAPGLGVHVPLTSPHWVKVGPEASVSFSITFQSEASQRLELAHLANARLRRAGFMPGEARGAGWREAAKILGYRVWRKWRALGGKGGVEVPGRRPY